MVWAAARVFSGAASEPTAESEPVGETNTLRLVALP